MLRADVNEMNVQPIDLGDELRQGVQFCLDFAPVVFRRPIARQRLHGCKLYSLGRIGDRLSFRPSRRVDAPAQFGKIRLRNVYGKRTNGALARDAFTASLGGRSWCHGCLSPLKLISEKFISNALRASCSLARS